MQYKDNLNIFRFGYIKTLSFFSIRENIKQFFANIKYAYQRAKRGYADCDIWNMDIYLGELISNMLVQLAKTHHGVPFGMEENEWCTTIIEMAEHFHNTLEDDSIPIWKEEKEALKKVSSHIIKHSFKENPDKTIDLGLIYDNKELYEEDRRKWLEACKRATEFMVSEKDIAFDMMKKYFYILGD